MSDDVNVQVEQQNRARLASLTRMLQINVFVSGIGMLVFWVSQIGLAYIWGQAKIAYLFVLIGLAINAFPIWGRKWLGMSGGMFNLSNYEVVTVDGLGNVLSTDSGFGSMQTNFFVTIIIAVVMLGLGLVIQPIRIIKMAIQRAVLKRKVKGSTTLLQNGGFLFVLYLLFGFVGLCGGVIIQNVEDAQTNAQYIKETEARFVKGVTVIIQYDAVLYEEPNSSASTSTKIPKGTRFTINDDLVKVKNEDGSRRFYTRYRYFCPVEYQGKKGWVFPSECFPILGTGKLTVEQKNLQIYDENGKYVDTVSVPAGAIVNVGDYSPPDVSANVKKARTTGSFICEYNGIFCAPFIDEIEVSPELKEKLGVKK